MVAEDLEVCKHFRNFTINMPKIGKNSVYERIFITKEEYNKCVDILLGEKNYLGLAWIVTAFVLGGRRSELIQFKTEIIDYQFEPKKKFVKSHSVRGKGQGKNGKDLKFLIPKNVINYWKLYVDNRCFESEYIFATKDGDKVRLISREWSNYFCSHKLSTILGRRINPHLFKASRVTNGLLDGESLNFISKKIAHHNDVSTTTNFYDLRVIEDDEENEDD